MPTGKRESGEQGVSEEGSPAAEWTVARGRRRDSARRASRTEGSHRIWRRQAGTQRWTSGDSGGERLGPSLSPSRSGLLVVARGFLRWGDGIWGLARKAGRRHGKGS
ncbi:uncharacterized protein M6B38_280770 [Iris pallida]|uniref:Uncharacterized protein n=1 Tax=Iris pallida TaxID=29817 RepID=A0AAX6I0C3_IRIPA|nr:uncharacterized protein M6B38_206440 [Iris pallida]KAJ6846423.1 uncharacterized protein M6B38_280770 [Iris pallida]